MKQSKLFEYGTLGNPNSKYLYRGLREEEIDAGIMLIPKGIQTFEDLKLIAANASGFYEPKNLGPILVVSNHNQGYPTSGVSTSTNFGIAFSYALSSPPKKRYVVMINREKARSVGIKEIIVKDVLPLLTIQKPDDDEVILISDTGVFPRELIEKAYKITELNVNNKN